MESKYYTPSLEEFHVGFEYEIDNTWGEYKKVVFEDFRGISVGSGNDRVPFDHKARVKYLDKEDIESLGFEFNNEASREWVGNEGSGKECFWYFSKNGVGRSWTIKWDKNRNTLIFDMIHHMRSPKRIFEGRIKNKSELKRVLKQVGIEV